MRIVLVALAVAGCTSPRSEPPAPLAPDGASPQDVAAPDRPPTGGDVADVRELGGGEPVAPVEAPRAGDAGAPDGPIVMTEVAPPVACRADQLKCNESPLCEPRAWGFEQGAAGWDLLAYNGRITNRRVRTGAAALSFEVFPGLYSSTIYRACGRSSGTNSMYPGLDVRGTTLVAWVNLEVTSGMAAPTECSVGGGGGGAQFRVPAPVPVTPDRWIAVRAPITATDINGANVWSLYVECWYQEAPAWTGVVHVDDVAFE